jgi:hypothetical protein
LLGTLACAGDTGPPTMTAEAKTPATIVAIILRITASILGFRLTLDGTFVFETPFLDAGGETFIGEAAWVRLKGAATSTMATFIDKYVREPLEEVLKAFPTAGSVPPLTLTDKGSSVEFTVGSNVWSIERRPSDDSSTDAELPDDIARDLPGLEGD